MTEEKIIDVSNCSHKRDDECMEVPICNEYGDLMGYQSCEAQTLCPYRSQKKIERLEQLKNKYYQQTLDDEITISDLITKCNDLEQENKELQKQNDEECLRVTKLAMENTKLEKENKRLKECKDGAQLIINGYIELTGKYNQALEEISSKLDRALDAEETDAEESFDLLYEIQDKISEVLNENK